MVLLVLCWIGGIGGSVGSIFKGHNNCWVGGFCFDTSSLAGAADFFGLKAERENTLNSAYIPFLWHKENEILSASVPDCCEH